MTLSEIARHVDAKPCHTWWDGTELNVIGLSLRFLTDISSYWSCYMATVSGSDLVCNEKWHVLLFFSDHVNVGPRALYFCTRHADTYIFLPAAWNAPRCCSKMWSVSLLRSRINQKIRAWAWAARYRRTQTCHVLTGRFDLKEAPHLALIVSLR